MGKMELPVEMCFTLSVLIATGLEPVAISVVIHFMDKLIGFENTREIIRKLVDQQHIHLLPTKHALYLRKEGFNLLIPSRQVKGKRHIV